MQVSLLNFGYRIVNNLSNQAMNMRGNSGQIKMGIIKKAVWHISGVQNKLHPILFVLQQSTTKQLDITFHSTIMKI